MIKVIEFETTKNHETEKLLFEKPKIPVVPFTIKRPEEPIKPFSINQGNETSVEETEENTKSNPLKDLTTDSKIRPIEFISNEIAETSLEICEKLQPILGEEAKSFAPHLSYALKNYKNSGHQITCISTETCKKTKEKIFNYDLILLKKVIHIFDTENGEDLEISYSIEIDLHLRNGKIEKYECEVKGHKIKSFSWINRTTNGLAKEPCDKSEMIQFKEMIQECLESSQVPTELIYPNSGWRLIPNIGWRFVYGTGAIGIEGNDIHTKNRDELFLRPTEKIDQTLIFQKAMEMCKICRSGSASTVLFLFTHAATLQTFFDISGFPINFILGIVGVTNSRKTSLALEMAKIFHRDKKRADAEFTATTSGIEKILSKYKDAPIIVDDFRPGETQADQKKLNERLESLVRFYGNRVPKRRMDDYSGQKQKFFPIQGVCVLTMEIVTGVTSSLSRMMLVEIDKKEVLNDRLLYFQKNPWILPSHIFDFIQWTIPNLEFILKNIASQIPVLRMKYQFEFPRFGEMYALFNLMAKFICHYAEDRRFWNPENSATFVRECDDITISLLRAMERRMKNFDKGILIVRSLIEAIGNGSLPLTKLNEVSCQQRELAYEDATRIFVQTKIIKRIVEGYCTNYKINTVFVNEEDILTALERLEILETIEKGASKERSRKLPIQRGNHLRYLYLLKEPLFAVTNEN